jgi:hypothetical protein
LNPRGPADYRVGTDGSVPTAGRCHPMECDRLPRMGPEQPEIRDAFSTSGDECRYILRKDAQ